MKTKIQVKFWSPICRLSTRLVESHLGSTWPFQFVVFNSVMNTESCPIHWPQFFTQCFLKWTIYGLIIHAQPLTQGTRQHSVPFKFSRKLTQWLGWLKMCKCRKSSSLCWVDPFSISGACRGKDIFFSFPCTQKGKQIHQASATFPRFPHFGPP